MDPNVWHVATRSLLMSQVLSMNYEKLGKAPEWREVEPYSRVIAGLDWLLVGRDPEDEIIKTFYLNRYAQALSPPELVEEMKRDVAGMAATY